MGMDAAHNKYTKLFEYMWVAHGFMADIAE